MSYILCIIGVFLLGVGITDILKPKAVPITSIIAPVSEAEVSDLIARLKPLALNEDSAWQGVAVKFYGGGVDIELRTKANNEYHGRAKTLKEAVSRISDPAAEVKQALEGWDAD